MLFDSQGRLVLQRRASTKDTYPDTWDVSCAGHIEEDDYLGGPDERLDEVYLRVAERELEEELGVRTALTFLGHFPPMDEVHYEQFHLYRGTHDGPYTRQPSEVDEIRPMTYQQWQKLVADGGPVTRSLVMLTRWFEERGLWGPKSD